MFRLSMSEVFEQQPIVTQVLRDVRCDRCGESCRLGVEPHAQYECAQLSADWGYWSAHDTQSWRADLCESCAGEVRAMIDAGAGVGVRVSYSS
jgi:hypothetical protein